MNIPGINIRVPATTANLGPGFDTFGLALKLYNRFRFEAAPQDQLVISNKTCVDTGSLSTDPQKSLIFRAMDRLFQELGKTRPNTRVEVEGHIPLARGLGSSSTAIVGGLTGANLMAGSPLDKAKLLELATEIEGHPDNVAPAILGGAVLCDGPVGYPLPWPEDWKILIAVPDYELSTEEVRKSLPKQIAHTDAQFNLTKSALLTLALTTGNEQAFRAALDDRLHQPYRGPLIAEFEPLKTLAQKHGAFGTVISGAGPSVAIFCPESARENIKQAVTQKFPELRLLQLEPDTLGAHESL